MALTNLKPHHTPASLVGPDGRDWHSMSADLALAVMKCDEQLRAHGMQMKIICDHCFHAGHPAPYVIGENLRGSTEFKLECPHAKRTYRVI